MASTSRPPRPRPRWSPRTASERSSEAAASGAAAFTLQVRAPKEVRDYLEKHLELQRFRAFPDLQERELSRLLGAADANARELLATLGYFSPGIQIDLTNTPNDRRTPRAIVVTVDPGERTTIKALDLKFQGDIEKGPTTSRPEARARAAWSLNPGESFAQEAWAQKEQIGLTLASDLNKTTARAYGVLLDDLVGLGSVSARAAFVVDKAGVIQYSEQTPTPKDLPNFEAIKAVLAKLA